MWMNVRILIFVCMESVLMDLEVIDALVTLVLHLQSMAKHVWVCIFHDFVVNLLIRFVH